MSIINHLFSDLTSPDEIRAWDAAASSEYRLPAAAMMENAARAAIETLDALEACAALDEQDAQGEQDALEQKERREKTKKLRPLAGSRVLVIAGKGNNGGDGAALARMLHQRGCQTLLCATTDLNSLPSPAAEHAQAALRFGVPLIHAVDDSFPELPKAWRQPDLIIDALTGSGLKGHLRPRELNFVRAVNELSRAPAKREDLKQETSSRRPFVLSLDIPSGLCGTSGLPLPEAVRADMTIAFEAPVRGLYLGQGREHCGHSVCRSVGMPLALRQGATGWRLLAPRPHADFLPAPDRHKGRAGRVLVIGGSRGMSGAARLAALGALRAGCGMAHIALPGALLTNPLAERPEFLMHAVGKGEAFSSSDVTDLLALIRNVSPQALVLGPGLGRKTTTLPVIKAILELSERPPCVVDADALSLLGLLIDKSPEWQTKNMLCRDVLTPHPGEAARLLPVGFFSGRGKPGASGKRGLAAPVQEDRPAALDVLCGRFPATVVLKGAHTLIGRKGERTVLSPVANAALGVGGSGDVLSGLIAALLASGLSGMEAACLGVYLHGKAGQILSRKAPVGHLASEIADAVPLAWKELSPC